MSVIWMFAVCWTPWPLAVGWAPIVLWGLQRHAEGYESGRVLVGIGVVWLVMGLAALGFMMFCAGTRGEPPQL